METNILIVACLDAVHVRIFLSAEVGSRQENAEARLATALVLGANTFIVKLTQSQSCVQMSMAEKDGSVSPCLSSVMWEGFPLQRTKYFVKRNYTFRQKKCLSIVNCFVIG